MGRKRPPRADELQELYRHEIAAYDARFRAEMAAAAAIERGLGAAEPHPYLSTACLHGLHDRCRHRCKFCAAPCRCACHEAKDNGPL